MTKQIIFIIILLITIAVFLWSAYKILRLIKLTKPAYKVRNLGKRLLVTIEVALFQTKIFRRPVIGLLHALVFWGFCVIIFGSIEMVIDGIARTERSLSFLGILYDILIASGDLFAAIISVCILVFLFRRIFMKIKRFHGIEMKKKSHQDANLALFIILMLMLSLQGMNMGYVALLSTQAAGIYPVSSWLSVMLEGMTPHALHVFHEVCWWTHILLIFLFANILPYSKHFHVFMSVPNVFLGNLSPMGRLPVMENIRKEVKMMMDPNLAYAAPPEGQEMTIERFGVLDAEDVNWKNYIDSLSCTQCGRCTSACPANITGKKLSPRKLFIDLRARMKERGPQLLKNREYSDNRSLVNDIISAEELWACTTCNACAKECPLNIDHPKFIVDMRRYLVLEQSAAPAGLNSIFSNIENNGAPWQFSPEDRLQWTEDLNVPVMAQSAANGEKPEYLWWVGSAGAFDDRYKKTAKAFAKLLNHLNISYAVLGTEESSSGDIARRAGNEMLFQMQAMTNVEILNAYEVKKIITCDPHVYNTFKHEYPDFGGNYEVSHHTQFIMQQIESGKLKLTSNAFKDKNITFHDPCYLGRINNEYIAPRKILDALQCNRVEMKRNRSFALCCGAGGGQMFKEAEKGDKEVFIERTEDALATNADIIATACPYCMVMMTDGLKYKNKEDQKSVYDIAELVVSALGIS
ncbi:MAG: (Fe-S)-binding protein [Bacteroidetes bacterium]|nr:(Fe-S)-binding protein [Bacteroidota bacterium]